MENDESKLLYETIVIYDKKKFDTRIRILNNRIILEKLKGLFEKKYKVIDNIEVNSIKIIGDKIQIKQIKERIIIKTNNKDYEFTCDSVKTAKNIIDVIMNIITGSGKIERASNKVKSFANGVLKVATTIGGTALVVGKAVSYVGKNKKQVFEAAKSIGKIFKP